MNNDSTHDNNIIMGRFLPYVVAFATATAIVVRRRPVVVRVASAFSSSDVAFHPSLSSLGRGGIPSSRCVRAPSWLSFSSSSFSSAAAALRPGRRRIVVPRGNRRDGGFPHLLPRRPPPGY